MNSPLATETRQYEESCFRVGEIHPSCSLVLEYCCCRKVDAKEGMGDLPSEGRYKAGGDGCVKGSEERENKKEKNFRVKFIVANTSHPTHIKNSKSNPRGFFSMMIPTLRICSFLRVERELRHTKCAFRRLFYLYYFFLFVCLIKVQEKREEGVFIKEENRNKKKKGLLKPR